MMPDYPNGVTGQMMAAGAEAFQRARYIGVALDVGAPAPRVLDSPSAIGCALARAFPAMLDQAEGGARDTLLHPGPIGAGDPMGWQAMSAVERAQFVLHEAPAHLFGLAEVLHSQRSSDPSQRVALAFLADALLGLVRQMERAVAIQCREQRRRLDADSAEIRQRREAKPVKARPKRRKPSKPSRTAATIAKAEASP